MDLLTLYHTKINAHLFIYLFIFFNSVYVGDIGYLTGLDTDCKNSDKLIRVSKYRVRL